MQFSFKLTTIKQNKTKIIILFKVSVCLMHCQKRCCKATAPRATSQERLSQAYFWYMTIMQIAFSFLWNFNFVIVFLLIRNFLVGNELNINEPELLHIASTFLSKDDHAEARFRKRCCAVYGGWLLFGFVTGFHWLAFIPHTGKKWNCMLIHP